MLYTMALQDAGPASGVVCTAVEADAAALATMESLLMLFPSPPIQCELCDTNLKQYLCSSSSSSSSSTVVHTAYCHLLSSHRSLQSASDFSSSLSVLEQTAASIAHISDCRQSTSKLPICKTCCVSCQMTGHGKTPKSNIILSRLDIFFLVTIYTS